jgi:hypothetical protein
LHTIPSKLFFSISLELKQKSILSNKIFDNNKNYNNKFNKIDFCFNSKDILKNNFDGIVCNKINESNKINENNLNVLNKSDQKF